MEGRCRRNGFRFVRSKTVHAINSYKGRRGERECRCGRLLLIEIRGRVRRAKRSLARSEPHARERSRKSQSFRTTGQAIYLNGLDLQFSIHGPFPRDVHVARRSVKPSAARLRRRITTAAPRQRVKTPFKCVRRTACL